MIDICDCGSCQFCIEIDGLKLQKLDGLKTYIKSKIQDRDSCEHAEFVDAYKDSEDMTCGICDIASGVGDGSAVERKINSIVDGMAEKKFDSGRWEAKIINDYRNPDYDT